MEVPSPTPPKPAKRQRKGRVQGALRSPPGVASKPVKASPTPSQSPPPPPRRSRRSPSVSSGDTQPAPMEPVDAAACDAARAPAPKAKPASRKRKARPTATRKPVGRPSNCPNPNHTNGCVDGPHCKCPAFPPFCSHGPGGCLSTQNVKWRKFCNACLAGKRNFKRMAVARSGQAGGVDATASQQRPSTRAASAAATRPPAAQPSPPKRPAHSVQGVREPSLAEMIYAKRTQANTTHRPSPGAVFVSSNDGDGLRGGASSQGTDSDDSSQGSSTARSVTLPGPGRPAACPNPAHAVMCVTPHCKCPSYPPSCNHGPGGCTSTQNVKWRKYCNACLAGKRRWRKALPDATAAAMVAGLDLSSPRTAAATAAAYKSMTPRTIDGGRDVVDDPAHLAAINDAAMEARTSRSHGHARARTSSSTSVYDDWVTGSPKTRRSVYDAASALIMAAAPPPEPADGFALPAPASSPSSSPTTAGCAPAASPTPVQAAVDAGPMALPASQEARTATDRNPQEGMHRAAQAAAKYPSHGMMMSPMPQAFYKPLALSYGDGPFQMPAHQMAANARYMSGVSMVQDATKPAFGTSAELHAYASRMAQHGKHSAAPPTQSLASMAMHMSQPSIPHHGYVAMPVPVNQQAMMSRHPGGLTLRPFFGQPHTNDQKQRASPSVGHGGAASLSAPSLKRSPPV